MFRCLFFRVVTSRFWRISFFVLITFHILYCKQHNFYAKNGVLDLRNYDFNNEGNLSLKGEWEVYWKEFYLTQEEFFQKTPLILNLPKTWDHYEIEGGRHKLGYATFRLKVLLPPNLEEIWIRSEGLYSNHALYANGILIAQAGKIGRSKDEVIPSVTPTQGVLQNPGETLELVLHISNFETNKGGMRYAPLLGLKRDVFRHIFARLFSDIFLIGAMVIMGAYYLSIYFFTKRETQALLFSLICFTFAFRTSCLTERLITLIFPNIPMHVYYKMLYISYFLITALMYDFLVRFFENTKFREYAKYNYLFALISTITVILLPIYYASYSLLVIQPYALLNLYICAFYLPLKYYEQIKIYVKTFLVGTILLIISLINDIFIENQIYQGMYLLGYGVIAFIFSLSYSFSIKMTKSFQEVLELSESIKSINESIVKFVPTEFIILLGKHNIQEVELGTWTQKDLTILFSDIRSFTSFAEKVTPQECFEFINYYLKKIGPIIRKNGGFIDKYIGDGIMALFPNKVEDALTAAIQMQNEVRKINDERRLQNKEEFKIGIGIHKGISVIGIVGEEQRTESTVIADAVNLASRIESLTKDFSTEILISTDAFLELENPFEYQFRFLGKVQVKGKSKFVGIVEILNSLPASFVEKILQNKTLFEEALGHYDSGQFSIAKTKFEEVLKENPFDLAVYYYLDKVKTSEKSFCINEKEGSMF